MTYLNVPKHSETRIAAGFFVPEGIHGFIGMQVAGEAYPYDRGGKDQLFPHGRYRYTLT
jgi:hypothetical protein